MEEILEGLKHKLDVSIYADPKYDEEQMHQIRLGLDDNIDITPYIDYKSTIDDIKNIKYALTHGFIPQKTKNNLK